MARMTSRRRARTPQLAAIAASAASSRPSDATVGLAVVGDARGAGDRATAGASALVAYRRPVAAPAVRGARAPERASRALCDHASTSAEAVRRRRATRRRRCRSTVAAGRELGAAPRDATSCRFPWNQHRPAR